MRILLAEDERRLSDALVYILKKSKYAVDVTYDGIEALSLAESGIYDVIVLDRMLPGMEGVDILREIRKKHIKTPVIFLTAKDTVQNRIEGLDAGADDYLIKPFSTDELMARIRALGRRSEAQFIGGELSVGAVAINPQQLEVIVAGKAITLSVKEMQLLELLTRNKEQTLTKEQILDRVWGLGSETDISNVELYIHYLRKKVPFNDVGLTIKTIRGVGYCLSERH
jgi:Response regulators consisting of a CheY-like receiver domain and a winged-helix DNA-binding domain